MAHNGYEVEEAATSGRRGLPRVCSSFRRASTVVAGRGADGSNGQLAALQARLEAATAANDFGT